MKSQLLLYTNAPVDEESPAWIEGLGESYSPLGASFAVSDFIPFDPVLDTTIRVDMDGYSFIKQTKNQVFNYCAVTYDGSDRVWYYFVRSAKWRANNTLALVLHMDVINSLLTSADFSGVLEQRTMIEREHENRFKRIGFVNNALDYIIRVDDVPEGLGQVVLRKTSSEEIVDEKFSADTTLQHSLWTIAYSQIHITEGDSYPLSVFLNPVEGTLFTDITSLDPADKGKVTAGAISNSDKLQEDYNKTIKIIEVPYCPYVSPSYDDLSGKYSFGDTIKGYSTPVTSWIYGQCSSLMGYYSDLSKNYNIRKINSFSEIYKNSTFGYQSSSYLDVSRDFFDTKLLHSDYYSIRYVYDSFSFSPAFERITANSDDLGYEIMYIVPVEPVSTIAFKFVPVGFSYKEISDFEQSITATVNNERTLITDPYLNYLRNGYNYDVKSKTLSTVNSLIVHPLTGAVVGAINPTFGAIGAVSGLISGLMTTIGNEISMDQKMAEMRSKSISTFGSNNLSVTRAITGNKLWKFTYEPSYTVKNMLDDLFYFYGYKRGYQGVPNATSRVWFNFVQCVPKWNPTFARSCKPFLDELGNKFKNGITFFHHQDVYSQPSWMTYKGYDLDQKSENWETIITGV